jgi:hypothetical protein
MTDIVDDAAAIALRLKQIEAERCVADDPDNGHFILKVRYDGRNWVFHDSGTERKGVLY